MKLTDALKTWAQENLQVAADAADEAYVEAITNALKDGTLDGATFAQLVAEEKSEPSEEEAAEKRVAALISKAVADGLKTAAPGSKKIDTSADDFEKKIDALVAKRLEKAGLPHDASFATGVMGRSAMSEPRVKEVVERYNHTKTAAVYPSHIKGVLPHPFAGRPAHCGDRMLDMPTERDKAIIGAVAKWMCYAAKSGANAMLQLNEEEQGLVRHALGSERWNGMVGCKGNPESGDYHVGMKLTKDSEYALVNDVVTGGAYAVPEIWDDAVVLNAVLYGELFPFVEVVNLPKGSFVHGMKLATDPTIWPTPGSTSTTGHGFYDEAAGLGRGASQVIMEGDTGGAFNTAQQYAGATTGYNYLQDMSGVIDHFDSGIYPAVAAMEIGRDWESDTPVSFGALIVDRMGVKLQEWLDGVIAVGSGVNQPLGLFGSGTGATAVTPTNSGSLGPLVVADLEKLMFGLSKAMRASKGGNKNFYVMSDQQYRLCRSIPWLAGSAATAQARAFGMDHEKYMLFDHPVKINDRIPSGALGFVNLAYYRLYRRLGMQISMTAEGQSLTLKNSRLIVGRSRWGGKLTKGDACAIMTSAEYPTYGYPEVGAATNGLYTP